MKDCDIYVTHIYKYLVILKNQMWCLIWDQ